MPFPVISSRKNQIIRSAAALNDAAARREAHMFLAEGARLCSDAAESGIRIRRLFFTAAAAERYQAYLKPMLECAGEAYVIETHVAALLSQTKRTQGIFCQCEIPAVPSGELSGKCVVLEDMQDPANLGAVMRTAEALGIDHVVLLGARQDPYAPKVLRASMGAVFRQPVIRFDGLDELFPALARAGSVTCAAVPDEKARSLGAFDFAEHCAVFIGNEGNGLHSETVGRCANRVKIPMRGRAESLNAAAAASIFMWEMVRGPDRRPV